MKTKSIPAIIMLIGGAVACILGLVNQYETTHFFKMIFIVLIIFYILGCITKMILDKNFTSFAKESADEEENAEAVKENIESEDKTENNE